jgi:putative chitinase
MLALEIMKRRWPHGDQHIPGLIEGIVASAPAVIERYELAKGGKLALVLAHAMGQFSEECGCGLEMIENTHWTVRQCLQLFPRHFTPSMAQRWAGNAEVLAEIAYGGRMGNSPPPSTDGFDFRGAGLSQVTGREGFAALQKKLDAMNAGFSILDDPELIINPALTFECGVADWIVCGCLPHAERDDILGETRALNGGLNGLTERRRQIGLWKKEFGV